MPKRASYQDLKDFCELKHLPYQKVIVALGTLFKSDKKLYDRVIDMIFKKEGESWE